MEAPKPLSRSEKEAKIKDKAGWVITVLAALLAINTLVGGSNSSKILNNTIAANDTWSFYQAKSIKQTAYELAALQTTNKELAVKWKAKADSYESDPVSGEGKKELMAKAKKLEAERADAKLRSPWYTYAGSLYQIAIVLLTASILAVNMRLFWASIVVGSVAIASMAQALWLLLPL
jgi:hypothetical protein